MNFIKNTIIFLVGGAAGALLTYRMLEKRYEEREAEMIAELERETERIMEELSEAVDTKYQDPEDESYELEVSIKAKIEEQKGEEYKKVTRRYTPYNTFSQSDVVIDEKIKDVPYIITEEQYNNELLYYDKVHLYYYEQDDALTDENEEIITNGYEIIGDDTLLHFGELSEDPDIVYARNESLSRDYEIIRLDKSYQETVLGFIDEVIGRKKAKRYEREGLGDE